MRYNGGVDGDYSPQILRASSTHTEGSTIHVTAIGTGLSAASSLAITASDHLWSVPLSITSRSDSALTASADVPAALPAAVLQAGGAVSSASLADLGPDNIQTDVSSLPDTILFRDPNYTICYPKDFAFFFNVVPTNDSQHPWRGLFHLFYIREYRATSTDTALAHAWSPDLINWKVDKRAFLPSGSGWDAQHVWAPSIVQIGNLYYMFYTGVDASGNQRLGYATTSLLDTADTQWTRHSTAAYSANNATSWADPNGTGFGGAQQFRDPFVMSDPDNSGRYLMFMAGEDKKFGSQGHMEIGAARNVGGTLDQWIDLGGYRATDYSHNGGITIDESPLVMRDSSGTGAWRIFIANAQYDNIGDNSTYFVTENLGASVSDTTLASWPSLNNLYTYLGSDNSLLGWQACEHLQVGKAHFFAAYQGDGIGITQAHWNPSTGNFVIGYPSLAGVSDGTKVSALRFYLAGYHPGSGEVRLDLETPGRATPRLVIYDVTGRQIRTLSDGRTLQGRQEYVWDRHDTQGIAVASGVYFARLTGAGAPQVLRVAVLR